MQNIVWICKPFQRLSVNELYDALKLRSDVFVVEQTCIYPDLDNKDCVDNAHHLLAYKGTDLVAYARLLPPSISYDNVSFGRVAVAEKYRSLGLGRSLMKEILIHCDALWPNQDIDIGAQEYLREFYTSFGFEVISNMYLEDGIEHIDMRLHHKH
ncbi:GNAT family N-acetyltransferase [Glaciecola sp. 2405UD65-10]|uniref:GNAT family N-acetyltransferase n=1 Tax=Glaciecola sp. 2405UD65-10 TaxID=3397244 RepID=UPI003B59FE2A